MKNLIEERDNEMIRRLKFKKKMDGIINLSAGSGERLLDEGAIVEGFDGDEHVRMFIAKGAMAKFLAGENEHLPNIDDDFTGYINLGHSNFNQDPTSLIGEWTKNDLSLVDIGNERQGIDVKLNLYDWHDKVILLKKLPFTVGISAEFLGHYVPEMSDSMGFPVYDEICIRGFAVVGNGANVNSNGISLKGEQMLKDKIEKLQNALDEMKPLEEEVSSEETEEEVSVDESEESEETPEETPEEETEGESDGESDDESSDSEEILDDALSVIERLQAEVESLRAENKELKGNIKKFTTKYQTLSVAINPSLKKEESVNNKDSFDRYGGFNDGIGEE